MGKTSLACATAVWLADQGRRTLLVSTDPASNVGQVFSQTVGHRITGIRTVENLAAMEVDPMAAAQAYRDRVLDPVRELMPADVISNIEEQLSGSCTTEIAAFDEFTALLTSHELREKYDHIVFDTAPTGHTIRMLELPGAWSGYLDAHPDAAANLGPLVGLEKQQDQYADAVKALSDTALTRLVLVARAQASTLKEVSHTHEELSAIGLQHQHLAINGVLPPFAGEQDPLAHSILAREERALRAMPENLAHLPRSMLYLKPFNLVGLEALRALFTESTLVLPDPGATLTTVDLPELASLVEDLSRAGKGLVMTMGKGGVGKTTVAAAVAVSLARRGHKVHLTTSDPAATCLTPWMARCQAFRSAVSIQKQRLSAIVALCWKIREKVWMKRTGGTGGRSPFPLHRRDCRVSGILPDHQRGQRPFCHYRHCAHRAYAAVAGCNRGLSPGNGAPDGAGSRSRDNANDAAAGSGEDQSHYRDACRNHAGTGSGRAAAGLTPGRD